MEFRVWSGHSNGIFLQPRRLLDLSYTRGRFHRTSNKHPVIARRFVAGACRITGYVKRRTRYSGISNSDSSGDTQRGSDCAVIAMKLPMSALGQKRTLPRLRVMSALPPCVDGSELARTFFTFAALVGAAMCSAFQCGTQAAGHNALRGSGPNQ